MTWDNGAPTIGDVFSPEARTDASARERLPGEPLEARHQNMAASLQALLEEVVLDLLRKLADRRPA